MFRTIVTGCDGSASSVQAVRSAAELAATVGGHLHVVTVTEEDEDLTGHAYAYRWADPVSDSRDALASAVLIAAAFGAQVSTHTPSGDPAAAIIRVASQVHADLIVVGNRGVRSNSRFAIESLPSRLVMNAPCSVLIIRSV